MNAANRKAQFGRRGESAAVGYLKAKGYAIVETNWRCQMGEIDIVARHHDTLVFVEVRSRSSGFEAAFESIGPNKRRKMIACAEFYLQSKNLEELSWRIDVIAVSRSSSAQPILNHLENALDW